MKVKLFLPPVLDVWGLMWAPQYDIWVLFNTLKDRFRDDEVSMSDYRFYFYDDFYKELKKNVLFQVEDYYKHQDIVNIVNWVNVDNFFWDKAYGLYSSVKDVFSDVDYLIIPFSVFEQSSMEYFLAWLLFSYYVKQDFNDVKIIVFWDYFSNYAKFVIEEFDFIDSVVLKGDKLAVCNLISNFESGKSTEINNVIYSFWNDVILWQESEVSIVNDVVPDYSQFELDVYRKDWKLVLTYEMWEWCRNNCFYCYNVHKWGNFSTKDVKKIVSEIRLLKEVYNTDLFDINDSEINYSREFLVDLAGELVKSDLWVFWSALVVPKELDRGLLELLYKAWCRQLRFWVESGSQKILDVIWKWTNVEEMEQVLSDSRDIWISVYASFIVDLPQETNEDIKLTMELIYRNKSLFDNIIICAYNTHIWNFDLRYFRYLLWKSDYDFCRTKRLSKKKILLRRFCDKLWICNVDVIDFLRGNYGIN